MTAQQLATLNIKGITIAEPYGTLLGEPEKNAVIFIWGEKGAGKSTMSLGLADALAAHGRIEYIPAEEHFGKTLVDRVKRLGATHRNLNFTKWKSIQTLKEILLKNRSFACILDSISVIDANAKETVELAQWCRENGIMFVMVSHATKDGQYKGNTSIAHECDIEIKVTKEGGAETEKNRYRELTSIAVPFTAEDRQVTGSKTSAKQEHDSNRENPVDTPFKITLKELDKLHKIRSWKRINSMFGSKMPCYAPKHTGESENAHLSIRYTADYPKKRYIMDLLLDGHLEYQACTEGKDGGLKACWKKLVKKYGDLEIRIFKQDHAKVVLGAKEYKRQERALAKKQEVSSSSQSQKKPANSQKKADLKQSSTEKPASITRFASSFDLPKNDRANIVFRQLHTLSSNTFLGIAYAKHDGTSEGIQQTARLIGSASYERYGNDLGNMASQYWATDEDGQVKWAISPNLQNIAEITTKAAFDIAGTSLQQWDVDTSRFISKPESEKTDDKQKGTSADKSEQSFDIEAAKQSQAKLDAFLTKILG